MLILGGLLSSEDDFSSCGHPIFFLALTLMLTLDLILMFRHPFSIVIAHRESIRNLTNAVKMPGYCHMAMFQCPVLDDANPLGTPKETKVVVKNQGQFLLKSLFDEKGKMVLGL
jgi:hypothetical protein